MSDKWIVGALAHRNCVFSKCIYKDRFLIWWSKFLLQFDCKCLKSTVTMLHRRICAHYKQMSEFKRSRPYSDRKRVLGRIQQSLDMWVEFTQRLNNISKSGCQHQNGTGRSRTEREGRAIVRAPASSLSTILRVAHTNETNITLGR